MSLPEPVWLALTALHLALAGLVIVDLLHQHRSSGATLAWVAILLLLPYAGLLLYFLAGAPRKHGTRLRHHLAELAPDSWATATAPLTPIATLVRALHLPGPTDGNRLRLFQHNESAAAALLETIEAARERLYVSVFSFEHDEAGDLIIQRLIAAARAGVAVGVLVDGYGSKELPRTSLRLLRDGGVRVAHFRPLPLALVRRGTSNFRNHRKMAVADGHCAWLGGRNFANKYFRTLPDGASWTDLSLTIQGPAAAILEAVCRCDWAEARGAPLSSTSWRTTPTAHAGSSRLQVLPSGPDLEDDTLHAVLLTSMAAATERIWIASPFFVPDDSLLSVLSLACRRGVDVRIVVPERSNQRFADWVRASYLRSLQAAGGQVLRYQNGMLHSKAIVIDRTLAVLGSANFDMRSLFTNHEICVLLQDDVDVVRVAECVQGYFSGASGGVRAGGFATQVLGGALRIAAPLI